MDQTDYQRQAHDNAIEAGQKLAKADKILEDAENVLREANLRMSNARKFEEILKERQKKLDRAFIMLKKRERTLQAKQFKENERQLLIDDNIAKY